MVATQEYTYRRQPATAAGTGIDFRAIARADGVVTPKELAAALWPEQSHRSRTNALRGLLRSHFEPGRRKYTRYQWRVDRESDLRKLESICQVVQAQPKDRRNVAADSGGNVGFVPDADSLMDPVRGIVGPGGRVIIPSAFREALGLKVGNAVSMRIEGEELRLVNFDTETLRIREMLARYVPDGVSVVDELLKERRREVAAEEAEVTQWKARQAQPGKAAAQDPR